MAQYCFAWDQNNRGVWGCKATTMECDGRNEGCPFFKTNEQHKADRQAANERIATLPDWQQTAISEKHYGGEKPWLRTAPKLDNIINSVVAQMKDV
jgi:hypothetical protein